jgi:Alkyl sulfatase dimerisation
MALVGELNATLMARAVAFADSARSAPERKLGWYWATATFAITSTAVVAAVLLWSHQTPQLPSVAFGPQKAPPPAPAVASAAIASRPIGIPGTRDVLRGKQPPRRELVVLTPLHESSVGQVPVIRWRAIEHVVHYEVRLLSADGDVLWREQVETDHVTVPSQLALPPGSRYFVLVRAYLVDGKTIDSRAVGFKVLPRSCELAPASVYPDLVKLAGGPEPLVRLALEKVEAGKPVEALHLTDVVLAYDQKNSGALNARIKALEHLQKSCENFVEQGWLGYGIAKAKNALLPADSR